MSGRQDSLSDQVLASGAPSGPGDSRPEARTRGIFLVMAPTHALLNAVTVQRFILPLSERDERFI